MIGHTNSFGRARSAAQQLAGKARGLVFARKRNCPPLPPRANAPPGELNDRRAEQVAAQRDGVAPRDIALRADRLKPDETSVGQGVHAPMNGAAGLARSNGNFESVESD